MYCVFRFLEFFIYFRYQEREGVCVLCRYVFRERKTFASENDNFYCTSSNLARTEEGNRIGKSSSNTS